MSKLELGIHSPSDKIKGKSSASENTASQKELSLDELENYVLQTLDDFEDYVKDNQREETYIQPSLLKSDPAYTQTLLPGHEFTLSREGINFLGEEHLDGALWKVSYVRTDFNRSLKLTKRQINKGRSDLKTTAEISQRMRSFKTNSDPGSSHTLADAIRRLLKHPYILNYSESFTDTKGRVFEAFYGETPGATQKINGLIAEFQSSYSASYLQPNALQ